ELVQNADDAGANEVVFVSDERQFDVSGGGLEGTQGPALLAYNDALMSPRDWTGLLRPGVSHKRKDPNTVGRFGLGFSSVYHLTDLPGVLSPPSLGVLDPECQVLPDAGARWDVSAAQDLPGLFEPFWAGLEAVGQHRGSAHGTLFRFPLSAGNPRESLQGSPILSASPLPVPGPSGDDRLSLTWCLVALHGDGVADGSEWLVATATDETATGLPVHASAPFALSDDRRHLRWPKEGEEGEEDARWNALLLLGLLPQVYSHMAAVATSLPGTDAYTIWPDPERMSSCGRNRSLVTQVCQELAAARTLGPATEGAVGRLRACLPAADRLVLLRYVAGDGCHAELRGLPLLPRADGTFVAFGTASAVVYMDTPNCPRELLPGLAGSFLPSDLEPGLDSLLRDIARAGLFPNLVLLDTAMTAQTLHLALPPTWMSQSSTPVTWCPAQGPPQPPASWFPALWQFLANHVEDLGPLEGLPLIPLSPLDAPSIRLARLMPQSSLIFQKWEDQRLPPAVASVLEVLGCSVVPPGIWHRSLSCYVLPPSPLNALRTLGRQGTAAVASRLASLPAVDVVTLRVYLADMPSLMKQDRDTLAALPIFTPLPSLATPQPAELVPAGATPALEPELKLPRDVVLPEAMLQCRDEVDRQLLGRLQRPLISAAHMALEAIGAVSRGAYAGRAAETQALLLWVLQHGDILFAQSPPLLQACSRLAFLETPNGPVCPRDLYDPCEKTLLALLGPERFPPAAFCSPPVLRALRTLGLRHGEGCLLPSDIIEAAASVNQGGTAAPDRAQALIKVCNCPKALAGFSAAELRQLKALPWVPHSSCTGTPGPSFLSPGELRSTRYQPLVGLAMHLTSAFVPEAEKQLGLSQNPPPDRVWEQLRQLVRCRDMGKVGAALRPVYQHMQEHLKMFEAAPNDAVVWTGSGFVLPCHAVLGYPEELELELGMLVPRVPPDFLPYSCLFRAWGVEARVSEERAVAALRCLGQDIDARSSRAGTAAELQVVVAVLEWLKSRGYQGEGTVPVPVKTLEGSGFALCPAASTVYLDMELEAEEDVQEVVHEAVPSSTAIFFSAELLSMRVLGPEPFTACGPSEPITLRLRNILREYGDEGDLFTEIVQNAEDAGATVCRFLLDLRHCRKATSGLLDPGMSACHGPALWAYNNALFTEDDLRNITRVGAATKEGQTGRIGRFGLGFNSVYRVTDVPSVLTGETLLIFDPNGTHLGKHIPRAGCPGIRLDFSSRPRILCAFAEQFWPYHGIFGCCLPEPGPFPGSLFRLPFRTEEEAATSEICSEAYGMERIQSLGTSFLGSNRLLLLFLRRVREMSIEMLPDMATSGEHTMPLATLRRKEIQDLGAPGNLPGWAAIEQLTACEEASKTTWHYLVLVCQGDGELLELFHRNTQAGLHPLPPMAGVALPLTLTADGKWVPRLDDEAGQVFCHLPMPIISGLPIHIHGAFSILSNRKGLWNTAEWGEWNRVLLRNGVTVAWLRALNHLRTMHETGELKSYEYHVFWPDTNTARYPFTEAVTGFYQAVAARNGPRLFSDGCSWCSLQDARFLHEAVLSHPKLGAVVKHVFSTTLPPPLLAVALPEKVQRGLGKAVDAGTYDWPRFYCELVLPNLEDLSVVDRDSLLLHALDMSHDDVDKDGRFPTGDAFLSPERLRRLERLGMVKDTMTLPELLERAKTVQLIWTEDHAQACRRAASILELLQDAVEERVNNAMQAVFQTVPFLPGTLPTGEHVLLPAAQLYHHLHAALVGLIHPILAHEMLGEKFSLPKEVASFLGLDRQLPAATVLKQLQALSCSSNALTLEDLQDKTQCCYRYLHMLLQRDRSSWGEVASAVPQGEPFILVGSRFVPITSVAEKLSFEAVPYLHQLPEQYQAYSQLWECVGLRHAFDWDDYAQVLCTLAEMHAGEPLPAAELALALRLVSCGLMADDKEPDAYQTQQLFLPDQKGILRPRDKLHFNDAPWMPVDRAVLLCHEKLSRAAALRSTAHDMVRELLQNADDAGAGLVHFVWDRRQHPVDATFSENWNSLQGPALCIYNDSPFQQQDIEGIQHLGVGGKQGRQDLTGKYGLGFNTVFHFTDCPAFLTGDSALCVFDPHLYYVPGATTESPGGMFAVNPEFKRTFPDIYGTFLPSLFNLNQGVLFRLPLRTAAGATISKVSGMVVRDQDLMAIETVLAEDGEDLLLFLRHLHTVVFSEITPDGGQVLERLRVATELTDGDAELRQGFQARLCQGMDGNGHTSVSYIMTVKTSKSRTSTVWRVISQAGVQEGAEESPVFGRLPYGSVAACLKPLGLNKVTGKAFCTLPLPLNTGLPVHINANFSVDAARRNLCWDPNSTEADWNRFLLRHLVAPLYCAFLTRQWKALGPEGLQFKSLKVCQQHLASHYLHLFPAVSEVLPTFQDMVRDVYRHLSHKRLPLVPVYHIKRPDSTVTMTWASPGGGDVLTEPYFLEETPEPALQEVLQHLNMNLVPAFTHLRQIYKEFIGAQVEVVALQPASLQRFLRALALPVPCMLAETPLRTPKSCSILLNHCLDPMDKDEKKILELEGLPLLVTQDGCLNALSIHHPVFHSCFAHLFPNHCHRFINKLMSNLTLPCFVKKFGLLEATPLIQEALGQLSWTREWEKWLKELWNFFSTLVNTNTKEQLEVDMKLFMDHLQDVAVLPVQGVETGSKHLLPLSSLPNVLFRCDTDVTKVLHKLGIPVLQQPLLPFNFAYHCLMTRTLQATDPKAVLARLANARADFHWKDLNDEDVSVLLHFVQGKLDSLALKQLQLLPLFHNYGGVYVPVAPYRKVLLLRSQFPELPLLAQVLYSLEKGLLLLTADKIPQKLAKDLQWNLTNEQQLFMTVVLPQLPQLTAQELMDALRLFFALTHICDIKYKEDVTTAFRTVAFIPDAHGVLRLASYFYDNTPSFCTLGLQHRFVPESFFVKLGNNRIAAQDFLLQAGVRTSLSAEDFVALALEIEHEASQAMYHAGDLRPRQQEMLKEFDILLGNPLSEGFLRQIALIHFLPPLDIPPDLMNLHPPFAACTKPVALKGSIYHCQEDVAELLWTSATILPKSFSLNQDLLKAMGVTVEIPTTLVVANLEQVCRAVCQTPQQVNTRVSVLRKVYSFLHTHLKEVDAGRLTELRVVLTKSGDVAMPWQVVTSLPDEDDFYPYLAMPDPHLSVCTDLLQHLGVVLFPTVTHYSRVLAQIYRESHDSGTLSTTQKKTVLLATRYFFQLLREALEPPDFSSVAELYLLSTADCLEPSHRLYFNDCTSSSTSRALGKTFMFMAELPGTGFNSWRLLQMLPQRLRPQALSKVTKQQLDEGSLQPCRYGSHCPGQRHLQTLLASPWFRMGLEALLRWQSHRTMTRMEWDGGFAVEQLKVQCCKSIFTVLVHCGEKVEGSSQSQVTHACLTGGGQRLLYIRHADAVLDRHQLRVLDALVQEINVMLGGQMEAPTLSVLREMLVCQEPQDIVFVLQENDVALVGAAPESEEVMAPELEKRLREEAVAEGKPWKGWPSLMPEVNADVDHSLATFQQLCAVKQTKVLQNLLCQYNPAITAQHHWDTTGQEVHGSWLCNEEATAPTQSIAEAQRWLRQAKNDLQAAHNDIGRCCPNWVLFKVHQALEKALVAAVLCHGEAFEGPVGLMGLVQWLEVVEPKLRGLAQEVEWLHGCGMDGKATQYPSYHPFPITPNEAFHGVDEEEVLQRVQGVLGRLQNHMGGM
ncbi:PREDICTED: sacsin-like, partial [Eurypyga helias]|uniref:sacsin-like n=1 Tax=Eurypyga helias TaxID=54383 RepID=UPI0005285B6F